MFLYVAFLFGNFSNLVRSLRLQVTVPLLKLLFKTLYWEERSLKSLKGLKYLELNTLMGLSKVYFLFLLVTIVTKDEYASCFIWLNLFV